MIFFLYGPDSFRSKRKLNEIIQGYEKANGPLATVIPFDAKEQQFAEFYSQFNTNSMFAKKKLVIVKNSFLSKEFQEQFLETIKDIEAAKDIVAIHEEKADERTKFFKELLKQTKSQKFDFLSPLSLKKWVAAEFKENGCDIQPQALELLVQYVKQDMWRLFQEIQKLSNFKKGLITKEDVALQVAPNIENAIFETIDALASKNKKQAITLLKNHLDAGDSPLYLLSMIAYQFRNFLIIKDLLEKKVPSYAIAKQAGLHPFVVQKSMHLVTRFSFETLKEIYRNIFIADEEIKTGKKDPEMALEILVAGI